MTEKEIRSGGVHVYNLDCFKGMEKINSNSIDLILTDPPYGITTRNEWDTDIDLGTMWDEFRRIIKEDGNIVITSTMSFAIKLIKTATVPFRYELIWVKPPVGFLNAGRQPLRAHELVLVFSKKSGRYFPQKYGRKKRNTHRLTSATNNYGKFACIDTYDLSNPTSVFYFANSNKGEHPTQKPIGLFKYLISTYSQEGEVVLDPFLGSGTTAVACKELGRLCIGFELVPDYYKIAERRLENTKRQLKLNLEALKYE